MFKNNLSKLQNKRLYDDLCNIPLDTCTENIAFVNTLDGNVVFLKGDMPVEDPNGPIKYVKTLVTDKIKKLSSNDVVISIGFGVGYILDELFNSTKAKIVIYEPDINYLRFIFETIDLTPYLEDKRVFISNDKDECINFFIERYLNDDKIEFVISEILALFYKKDAEEFSQLLYGKLKSRIVDVNTIKKLSKEWVKNMLASIKSKKEFYNITALRDAFTEKNALILSAGPSLKENIENIKLNRNRFVIFAVNRVLPILEENGIIPDFTLFADAIGTAGIDKISPKYISELNVVLDWKAEANLLKYRFKNFFRYFSDNEMFIKRYAADLNLELLPAEATTTMLALRCAHIMGFNKIYFCGFDLAFKDDVIYSSGEVAKVKDGVAIINKGPVNIVQVMSVNGKMVNTRDDYSVFIENMKTYIKTNNLKNLYNITDFGALIEGMHYTKFDEITEYKVKPNIDELIAGLKVCKADFSKYVNSEKNKMILIHNKVISMSSIHEILNLITDTTIIYEYIQFELLEFLRQNGTSSAVDKLYSELLFNLDILLALM